MTERLTSLKANSKQVEKEVTQIKSKVEIIELENDKMDQKMKDLMKEMSMDGEKMKHAWNKVICESISKLVFTQKMSQGDLTNLQDKVKEKSETLYGVLIQQFEVMARQEFATENSTPGIKNGMKWNKELLGFTAMIGEKTKTDLFKALCISLPLSSSHQRERAKQAVPRGHSDAIFAHAEKEIFADPDVKHAASQHSGLLDVICAFDEMQVADGIASNESTKKNAWFCTGLCHYSNIIAGVDT